MQVKPVRLPFERLPRQLYVTLKCVRKRCGTRVSVSGDVDDPILKQVARWGSSCPKCGDDLDVVSQVTLPEMSRDGKRLR